MKCPRCMNDEFLIKALTRDLETETCIITADSDIEYVDSDDQEVCDTDYYGNAVCNECGCNIEIATGAILGAEVELRPYSVLLLYPETQNGYKRILPETYYNHVYAVHPEIAIERVKAMAHEVNPDIDPDEFKHLGTWLGHLEQEEGAVF